MSDEVTAPLDSETCDCGTTDGIHRYNCAELQRRSATITSPTTQRLYLPSEVSVLLAAQRRRIIEACITAIEDLDDFNVPEAHRKPGIEYFATVNTADVLAALRSVGEDQT